MKIEELKSYLPKDKFDDSGLTYLQEIGFPGINPILPELLEWIQDINWPVAQPVCSLLSKAGEEIIPYLEKALESDDFEWGFWIIECLLPKMDIKIQQKVKSSVEIFSRNCNEPDYVDIAKDYLKTI